MAYLIVQTTDFVGFQGVAQSNDDTILLQTFIDRWEKFYIYHLLSNNAIISPPQSGLADLFIASIVNGVPVGARYLKIFNAFFEQNGSKVMVSKGMKDILVSFIFYHYVMETGTRHGQSGVFTPKTETGDVADFDNTGRFAERRWNEALSTVDSIRWWLKVGNANGGGQADYPEYIDYNTENPDSIFQGKWSAII